MDRFEHRGCQRGRGFGGPERHFGRGFGGPERHFGRGFGGPERHFGHGHRFEPFGHRGCQRGHGPFHHGHRSGPFGHGHRSGPFGHGHRFGHDFADHERFSNCHFMMRRGGRHGHNHGNRCQGSNHCQGGHHCQGEEHPFQGFHCQGGHHCQFLNRDGQETCQGAGQEEQGNRTGNDGYMTV